MSAENSPRMVRTRARSLASIMALMVATTSAQAPRPDAPRAADPAAATAGGAGFMPRSIPLTEAQKLINELPPPQQGFGGGWASHAPDAPMPSADPRDLQGTWIHGQNLEIRNAWDMYGLRTPFTLTGAQTVVRRVNGKRNAKPYITLATKCLPPGPLWQLDLNFPFQIFQSRDWVEVVFGEFHGRWKIAFDAKFLPPADQKEYQGRSIAHWDGNTLVVETTNFRQNLWLDSDGAPFSKNGKMVTRIRKVDNGDRRPYLEMVHTFFDPINYTNPWSVVRMFNWVPERTLFAEYNCEEQTGDPSGLTDAGFLVDEPSE